MYKKLVFIFIAALMGACTSRQQADEKTLYVSILPLRSLVGEIVGDDFKIEVLVPPGASPETFEPTPRQFIGLNRAEMIFNVGLIDFETTLLSKIEERGKQSRCDDIDKGKVPLNYAANAKINAAEKEGDLARFADTTGNARADQKIDRVQCAASALQSVHKRSCTRNRCSRADCKDCAEVCGGISSHSGERDK